MLNELLILTKIKAGDIKAFEELFRCYYSPLCATDHLSPAFLWRA